MKFLSGVFVIQLAINFALWVLASWFVMILLGIAHSFDGRVPDLGFATTLCVLSAFYTVYLYVTRGGDSS